MKRIILILSLTIAALSSALAQTFSVQPPRNVVAGQKFSVTYRLENADGSALNAPQINGCTLLYGPSTSSMQSYQVINGRTTSSTTMDYSYYYRADKEGTYTIPSASINVDGKTLRTKEVSFKVLPPDQSAQASQNAAGRPSQTSQPSQASTAEVGKDEIFVRIILNKQHAFEQEAVDCVIKLYTKTDISAFVMTKPPTFDGFLIEEVDQQARLNEVEHYNGQNYMTAVLKHCIIFPQKSGKLKISSGEYDITIVQYERIPMGFFYTTRPVEKKVHLRPYNAETDITPLPSPRPAGFTDAVGQFSFDSSLSSDHLRTGEAGSLTYTISGTGNIKYLKEPKIDFPTEFEQYTPKSEANTHVSGSNVSGTLTIEYTFVPQSVGDFTIPAETFVYFDPAKKQYVTLSAPSYPISVAKGTGASTSVDQQAITAKNTDILHIKLGDKGQSLNRSLVVDHAWYWAIYGVLLVALLGAIAGNNRKARLDADVAGRKNSRANKVARKRLKAADASMRAHKSEQFYEEMLRALWGYLSDKLGIPVSQLSRQNIVETLSQRGVDSSLTERVIAILDECEMARYTPNPSDESLEKLYGEATDVINAMEKTKINRQK